MNRRVIFILSVLMLLGFVLRFYRLGSFATFLSDQGRDAIILKRILAFEHLPAIGAPTSVGQVYLGPFYYYFIAPWLLLFGFNPIGPAAGVAFFSCLYLSANFFIVKKLFNQTVAVISTFLLVFSFPLIELSRFSWNPNLLPFFSLLTYYFLVESLKTKRWYWFTLTGSFLSFSIQLHYLALFMIFPIVAIYLFELFKSQKNRLQFIIDYSLFIIFFIVFTSPLLIFDLRHDFLNANSFIKLFSRQQPVSQNKFISLIDTFSSLNQYSFQTNFSFYFNLILLLLLALSLIFLLRKNHQAELVLFFIFNLIGLSLFNGPKHYHYFTALYPFYYILISLLFSSFLTIRPGKIFLSVFLILYLIAHAEKYYFLRAKGSFQISHSRKVADFLAEKINRQPFNIASWPVEFAEDNYLYFLEIKGLRPADRQKVEVTNQMFVLCNKEPCQVIDSPSWNISMFGKAKIDKIWNFEGLKIFKLTHK